MNALTPGADLAWKLAAAEAANAGHPQIENALLLVGILSLEKVGGATAEITLASEVLRAVEDEARRVAEVLERCGVEAAHLRRLLRERVGKGAHDHHGRAVGRSPGCKETFYRAAMLSGPAGVSSLDLLAALGEAPDALVARAVREAGARVERLRDEARRTAREGRAAPPEAAPVAEAVTSSSTPHLDRYGRDLTALAARGELGPVVGRRAELLHVLQTLARASKNNPVLVGEPGVGKTSIVEAVALRAAEGKDPSVLGGKRIVELSLRALVAGTTRLGVLEERTAKVLAEVREHPEVVLFVDARLAVTGAGETEGGGADVAELLRPAIARGEVRVIGAATAAEYREHIQSDPALERRLEKVPVNEPSREETLEVLHGLRPRWERHHQLRIDDQALEAAVDLSVRFDPEHNLPEKAVDLVTKAAARIREGPGPPPVDHVTERTVVQVMAEKAGLPLELVEQGLSGRLWPRVSELEGFLRERIIGQDDAIARLCRRLRSAHAATREERPLATLLFLGPPGVGKRETARLAASFLLGKESALLRFDMSEYAEEDGLVRLVGSPPGGPGHEDGQLVTRLRTTPRAVVLLDSVEKAHPRVLDGLSHVLEAGRVTDGRGRCADTHQAVFILTSNAGSAGREPPAPEGGAEGEAPAEPPAEARRLFRPDLLSRIDETIAFRALGPEDAARILRTQLRTLSETVERQHGIRLEVDAEAEAFIARTGFSPASGVRGLRRIVERLVEAPLSSLILDGKIRKYPAWHVAYDEGGIYIVPRT